MSVYSTRREVIGLCPMRYWVAFFPILMGWKCYLNIKQILWPTAVPDSSSTTYSVNAMKCAFPFEFPSPDIAEQHSATDITTISSAARQSLWAHTQITSYLLISLCPKLKLALKAVLKSERPPWSQFYTYNWRGYLWGTIWYAKYAKCFTRSHG